MREIAPLVGLFVGLGGLIFGLYQYYRAERWKRSEFAAKQNEKLLTDPILILCLKFLGWSELRIPVPEEYKVYTEEMYFEHDWQKLKAAMADKQEGLKREWWAIMYRDYFDHLFKYFQKLNHFTSIGLFSSNDLHGVRYYLRQIAHPPHLEESPFNDYLKRFNYNGVYELMDKFKIERNDR